MNSTRPDFLIIYEETGGGHKSCAYMLERILLKHGYCVLVKSTYQFLEIPRENLFCKLWNYLVRNNFLTAADLIVNKFLRKYLLLFYEIALEKRVRQKIQAANPSKLISVADGINRVFGLACADIDTKFFVLIHEMSVFADNLSLNAHHLVLDATTKKTVETFNIDSAYFKDVDPAKHGLLNHGQFVFKCWFDFTLTPNKFFSDNPHSDIFNNLICSNIGPLRDSIFFNKSHKKSNSKYDILIVNGSLGGHFVLQTLKNLDIKENKGLKIIAVCSGDTRLYSQLSQHNFGFVSVELCLSVTFLSEILKHVSVTITRSSTAVVLESLLSGVPVVCPIPRLSNEFGLAKRIASSGLGEIINFDEKMFAVVANVLCNREQYVKNIEDYLQHEGAEYHFLEARLLDILTTP